MDNDEHFASRLRADSLIGAPDCVGLVVSVVTNRGIWGAF